MKYLTLIVMLLALSGCASLELFENRVTMPVAGDRCFVDSKWGMIGISTPLSSKDCAAIQSLMRK